VLEKMAYRRRWRTGEDGVLEKMVYWRRWCTGEDGVLEKMVYWRRYTDTFFYEICSCRKLNGKK